MSKKTKTHEEVEMYIGTHLEDSRWSQDSYTRVLRNFAQKRGASGFTEDETTKVQKWVYQIEFGNELLKLVEEGEISVDVRSDGEVVFYPNIPDEELH